jgi:acyl dehydratase
MLAAMDKLHLQDLSVGQRFATGTGGELLWTTPVRPGDTLKVDGEVLEIVPSRSKPDRGAVTVRCTARNQHGEMVRSCTPKLVVPRRGKER